MHRNKFVGNERLAERSEILSEQGRDDRAYELAQHQ